MTFSPVLLRCCSHAQTRSVSELGMRVDGSPSVFTSIMQFFFFFFLHPCIKKKKKIIAVMVLLFYRLLHFTFCFSSRFPRLVLISFLFFFFFCVCVYDYIRATSQSFSIDKKETPFFFLSLSLSSGSNLNSLSLKDERSTLIQRKRQDTLHTRFFSLVQSRSLVYFFFLGREGTTKSTKKRGKNKEKQHNRAERLDCYFRVLHFSRCFSLSLSFIIIK